MTDNDFRQFNGAFDTAIEPDAAFAERLQQRMKAEAPGRETDVPPTVVAQPPSGREQAPPPPRRSHPLFIAAGVLMVFALAAASIIQLAPRVLEPEYADQSVATLPADASTTPGADMMLSAEPILELTNVSYYHPHGENLVVVRFVGSDDAQQLVSYNLQTDQVEWEQGLGSPNHFVFSDDVVVGVSFDFPVYQNDTTLPTITGLVAFDITTGEELWSNSSVDWDLEHGWETVNMAGDYAVVLRAGEIIAFDARTGERTWTAEYDLAEAQEENWVQPPVLAELNGELYLMQVDGSVQVLNLATGEVIREFAMPASFRDSHPVGLQLNPVPSGLLVIADTYAGSGALTTLMVINPENGDVVWERSLAYSGVTDVAPDGSIAIATHTWESPPLLMRMMGKDGHSTSALTWLDADGEVILDTDRVRMPEMGGLVIAGNGEFICGTTEEFACFDRDGTRYVLDAPNVGDAQWVGDTMLVMTERGVMRVEIP